MIFVMSGCTPETPWVTENNLPVAVIRSISSAKAGEAITLDGRDSYDLDGDVISCQWTLLQGPAEVSFSDQKALVTQFVASAEGTYRFELTVTDGKGDGRANIEVEVLSSPVIVETVALPVCEPADGSVFRDTLNVTINSKTKGAIIYYTLNGSEPTAKTGTLYTGAIRLNESTMVRALACKEGMYESPVTSAMYTKHGTVGLVTFLPASGEVFQETLEVSLSCETDGAAIYYTLDGSEPTVGTGTLYTGTICLNESTMVRALAYKEDMYASPVTESQYVRWETVADPQFVPQEQYQFQDSMEITLTCETPGATIMYTTNGKKPSRDYGNVYTGPITLTASTTVGAMAYKDGMYESSVVRAGYVRLYPVAKPAFSYASGFSFEDSLDVTISCGTSGATIRYTTDGTDPTRSNGETYTGPIELTATTTLKAMAYKYSMIDTAVVSATYSKISGRAQKWRYTTGGAIDSTPAIANDGTIYVGSYDKKLYAFKAGGMCKWACDLGGWIFSSPSVGSDGTVYIGSTNNIFYAVDSNGRVKWSYNTGKPILSSSAIGSNGEIYIYIDGKLIAFNSNGSRKWEYATTETDSYNYSSPVVGRDGTIYIGSVNKKFYAVNSNGTSKWTFQTSGYIQASAAIDDDGTIYIGSGDHKLYALNSDGSLKWSYQTGGYVDSTAAVARDGTIYFGSADYKLYALNSNGTLKWTYATGKAINASPTIRYDGVVYITSRDGCLYAINPDGSLDWSFATGAGIDASPAIGRDGTVYTGSQDKNFYAIEAAGCLADSPWPKFQYNNRQSGSLSEP